MIRTGVKSHDRTPEEELKSVTKRIQIDQSTAEIEFGDNDESLEGK